MSIYGRGEQKKYKQTRTERERQGYANGDILSGITLDRKIIFKLFLTFICMNHIIQLK